jgi:hypothetical protein
MKTIKTVGYLSMCLSMAACSAPAMDSTSSENASSSDDPEPATSEVLVSGEEQLINRFRFEDLELSFYWMGSPDIESREGRIAIEESFGSVDYLGALRQRYGALTALEIFKAFAPADLEPHQALIAQHEAEALGYGRALGDLEPRDVDGRALSVDKSIPTNCSPEVFPDVSPRQYISTSTRDIGADGQFFFLCVNGILQAGSVSQPTSNLNCTLQSGEVEMTVGICNDTASLDSTEFFTQANDLRGSRFTTQRTSVAPGRAGRFSVLPLPPPFDRPGVVSLGVIGRNSAANLVNFHRQLAGIAQEL